MVGINNISNIGVCSINLGYANTKVIYGNRPMIFESRISNYCDEELKNTICVDGNRYAVGVGTNDLEMDKTVSKHHRVIMQYALSKIQYDKVNTVAALPCDVYLNKRAREDYCNFVKGFNKVKDCLVYMEGFASVFADLDYYMNNLRIIMDIGGKTINLLLIDNGKLVKGSAFSMNLGSIILSNRIKKALEQDRLCVIHENQIKYMIKDNIAKTVLNDYSEEIKNELRKHDYPTGVQIRCTGGGAVTYKDLFKEKFNADIGENAIFENALGMYAVGLRYWR